MHITTKVAAHLSHLLFSCVSCSVFVDSFFFLFVSLPFAIGDAVLLSSLPVGFAPLTYVGCLFIVGYAIQFIWYFLFILLFSTFSSILWALGFAWLALALTIEKPQSGGQTNQPTNKQTNRQTNVYKRGHSHCTTGRMSYELCAMRRLAVCVAATKTSWCVFVPFSIAIFLVCLFAHLNCLICIK